MKNTCAENEMLTEENRKDILNGFLETIKSISDLEYQKRAWIKGIPPGTDFDETVNSYSLDARGIIEKYKDFQITKIQLQFLKRFDKHFREFYDENSWPPEFIDTPEWDEITKMAADVLKAFDYKSTEDKKNLLKVFLQVVCGISNNERKKQEWVLAEGPECYDYGEICYRLVDEADLILKNYKDFGITDSQYQIMKKFRDRYYVFSRPDSWPPEFTDIPEWTEIRELAKEVLKAFDYKPEHQR